MCVQIQNYSKSRYEIRRNFNRKFIKTLITFVKWQLGNFGGFLCITIPKLYTNVAHRGACSVGQGGPFLLPKIRSITQLKKKKIVDFLRLYSDK